MHNILVIGCGNIGAQYDFKTKDILTHIKAFTSDKRCNVSIYDINKELVSEFVEYYKCSFVNDISITTLSKFDLVCICTPTSTHYEILKNAMLAEVKTVICEKPVAYCEKEIKKLKELYLKSESRVIVNYIRRFQPEFINLKDIIRECLKFDSLTNISIKYQKGFINNCTHAIDLIEYLLEDSFVLNGLKTHNKSFDVFKNDPTLSLQGFWNKVNVNILGLSNILFSQFEVDLYFKKQKISIKDAGNTIEFYTIEKNDKKKSTKVKLLEEKTKTDCIKDYMIPVKNHLLNIVEGKVLFDNFIASIELNLKSLKYIKE